MTRIMTLAFAITLSAGCIPKKDLSVDQIAKLTDLEDLMHVQGTLADPQMKKAGAASYADADFTAFADVGARIQATSVKLKDFSKGAGWDTLALQLEGNGKSLADAAAAKDAASASKALTDMKATCKACHKQFR